MRTRLLLATALLAGAAGAVPARAGEPVSPTVTMTGPWGTVTIAEDRLLRLGDESAHLTESTVDAFLSRLTTEEQIALEYGVNPALVTSYSVDGADVPYPCGSTVDECDPPEPQPAPEVDIHHPEPPPPAKVCGGIETTQTWKNAIFRKDALYFRQTLYRCWDGLVVSDVYQVASYELTGWALWWTCSNDQLFPRYDYLPPAEAPSVHLIATGHCSYRPRAKFPNPFGGGDIEVDLPLREIFPRIHVALDAFGGAAAAR